MSKRSGFPELSAVVTGGTRGIGFGIAESLVKRGACVAITYLSDETAAAKARGRLKKNLREGQKLILLKGDAGDPVMVEKHYRQVLEELGSVNVLVNNAGIMHQNSFEGISDQDWDRTIQVNLNSAFYWTSRVIPEMKARQFGRIINIASISARGGGVIGPHYAASKAGIVGLTRYAAQELGCFGITVNAIAPAFIQDAGIFLDWTEKQLSKLRSKVKVQRLGNVSDVVLAFEYLIDSSFVTGVTLDVNGGAFMI